MGYIKNALFLIVLSYSHSILNTKSKDILKNIVNFKLKKYKNEFEDISNFIDYCLDDQKPIQNNDIDFQYIEKFDLNNKSKKMFDSISNIKEFELENDIEEIVDSHKKISKKGKDKHVK